MKFLYFSQSLVEVALLFFIDKRPDGEFLFFRFNLQKYFEIIMTNVLQETNDHCNIKTIDSRDTLADRNFLLYENKTHSVKNIYRQVLIFHYSVGQV